MTTSTDIDNRGVEHQSESDRSLTPSFVAYCQTCSGMIAAAVGDPLRKKENAKHVAGWIRSGLRVGTVTVAEVRAATWCSCPREKKKRKA